MPSLLRRPPREHCAAINCKILRHINIGANELLDPLPGSVFRLNFPV